MDDDIRVDEQLLRRVGDAPDPALDEQIATALVISGVALSRAGSRG